MAAAAVAVAMALAIASFPGCGSRPGTAPRTPETAPRSGQAAPETDGVSAAVAKLLRKAATADDEATSESAVTAIVALGEPAIPALSAALTDGDEEVRGAAVDALGRFRVGAVIDPLLRALNDQSWEVRLKAVEALGTARDRRAVKPLLDRYHEDDDPQVRYECLTSLGLIGDSGAVDLLVKETGNTDPYARMWAMDALCEMGDGHAPSLAVALLGDPDVNLRRQILRSCGRQFDSPEGHEALIELALSAEDFETTVWARRQLTSYLQGPSGNQELEEKIRRAARAALRGDRASYGALVLGEMGDPIATERLMQALRDPNPLVRHHAAYQLGKIGDRRAVPALVGALNDRSPLVVATALHSLRAFADAGDPRAREAVARHAGQKPNQR